MMQAEKLPMQYLPFYVVKQLDIFLNPTVPLKGNDWRAIADHANLSGQIMYIQSLDKKDIDGSNFQYLLNNYLQDKTVKWLLDVLLKIERLDAHEYLLQEIQKIDRKIKEDDTVIQDEPNTISTKLCEPDTRSHSKNVKVFVAYAPDGRKFVKNFISTLDNQNGKFSPYVAYSGVDENEMKSSFKVCDFAVIMITPDYAKAVTGKNTKASKISIVHEMVLEEWRTLLLQYGNLVSRILPVYSSPTVEYPSPVFQQLFSTKYIWQQDWESILFYLSNPARIVKHFTNDVPQKNSGVSYKC